jgi:hypothetical protein
MNPETPRKPKHHKACPGSMSQNDPRLWRTRHDPERTIPETLERSAWSVKRSS